ncbi:hypothetical protein N0V86_006620 [Didymella sp. IMI 355093]|nr:hypothetical protein N0V86_006620 [Didymella sp. IMI 355093]
MAKKKKSTNGAANAVQDSHSRYASPPVTLRVGPELEPYYVPEVLLDSLRDLPRSNTAERSIDLPDIDVNTAHVIVHFLYTGQYQRLCHEEEELTPSTGKADFKQAIATFVAAKRYGLITLQELARSETVQCSEKITIVQAAHGVGKDVLAALQEDAGWLQDLVLLKAEQVFEDSDEIFSSASFFSGIKSLKLAKILGQHVAKLYHGHLENLGKQLLELEKSLAEQSDLLKNFDGTAEQIDASVSEAQQDQIILAEEGVPLPPEVEVPIDDWDFPMPKKKKKKKMMAEYVAEQEWFDSSSNMLPVEPETVAEPATEALPIEPSSTAGPDVKEDVIETIANGADAEDSWGSFSFSNSKKKKKKGKKTVCFDEAPAMESGTLSQALEAPEPSSDPISSIPTGNTQENPSQIPQEMSGNTVEEPAAVIEESPVVVEPPPASEQDDPWAWGAILSSGKKKKKKKGKIDDDQPPPEHPPSPDPEIVSAMAKDLIEPELRPCLESAPPVEEKPPVDAAGDICPWRYEHLTQDDALKDCKQCELFVQRIAVKLT